MNTDIETRLRKLERTNQIYAAIIGVGVLAGLVGWTQNASSLKVKTLEAENIVVTDQKGKGYIALSTATAGPRIAICNEAHDEAVKMQLVEGRGIVTLGNKKGNDTIKIDAEHPNPLVKNPYGSLAICNQEGTEVLELIGYSGTTSLGGSPLNGGRLDIKGVGDVLQTPRVSLTATTEGPQLFLFGKDLMVHAGGTAAEGGGFLRTYDSKGKQSASLGE